MRHAPTCAELDGLVSAIDEQHLETTNVAEKLDTVLSIKQSTVAAWCDAVAAGGLKSGGGWQAAAGQGQAETVTPGPTTDVEIRGGPRGGVGPLGDQGRFWGDGTGKSTLGEGGSKFLSDFDVWAKSYVRQVAPKNMKVPLWGGGGAGICHVA